MLANNVLVLERAPLFFLRTTDVTQRIPTLVRLTFFLGVLSKVFKVYQPLNKLTSTFSYLYQGKDIFQVHLALSP